MPTPTSLDKLAQLAIRSGLGVMPGQDVFLVSDIRDADLARRLTAEAYRAGARTVIVNYIDDEITLIRYQNSEDAHFDYAPAWQHEGIAKQLQEGMAYLRVTSSNPALLKSVDPALVARSSKAYSKVAKPVGEAVTAGATNWCIIPAASPEWAKLVFPDLSEAEAVEKLWDAIFFTTRADQPDPVAAWKSHVARVMERVDFMNKEAFAALRFHGGGTDLKVGLVEGHQWEGVELVAKNGATCSPNIPTEEIFTTPHRLQVEGVVRSTKPLSLRGQLLDGIEVTFKDGKAVSVRAEQGQEALEKLIDTDEGARYLGEVALVPHSSPISKSGLTFYNTLFDENASCHIALGQCYQSNVPHAESLPEDEQLALGMNMSLIHVDWMIGSAEVNVDGIRKDGTAVPLMKGCDWV